MVKILDCTTRDGGHDTNWQFDRAFVSSFVRCLNSSKIDFYEIGYCNSKDCEGKGEFYRCEDSLLDEFAMLKRDFKIGVMVDVSRFSPQYWQKPKNIDFVRIATHPNDISKALKIAEILSESYRIFVQLMEIPNVKEEHYHVLAQWERKDILESLYFADSYSMVLPSQIEQYFCKLYQIGYERVSFHAHNLRGYALENTIKAIESGAYSVDVSLNAMGGNTDASALLKTCGRNCEFYDELRL